MRHNPQVEGIYLDDLNHDDPEIAELYFPRSYRSPHHFESTSSKYY